MKLSLMIWISFWLAYSFYSFSS